MVSDHGQDQEPLVSRLLQHIAARRTRFHVPGHKGKSTAAWWRLDLTELGGLDDLHHPAPDGVIARAQGLAARAFGAQRAYFLVGGSTSGVLAMTIAAAGPGDLVLATLPCHRSVAAAAVLSGCRLSLVAPRFLDDLGIPAPPAAAQLAALIETERPAAVLVTTPTYHGLALDIRGLADRCARAGVPLLVDAAHGAHFGWAPGYPPSPLAAGPTACVMSLHKTAGALTPGALLATGTGIGIDPGRLEAALRLVQTSSPPFPVLASLDAARRRLATRGPSDWGRVRDRCRRTREALTDRSAWLRPLATAPCHDLEIDPARLVITLDRQAPAGLTGTALAAALAAEGVDIELAGWSHLAAVATPADTGGDHARLVASLVRAERAGDPAGTFGGPRRELALALEKDCWGAPTVWDLPPRDAFRRRRATVPLSRAVGRIAADVIAPYPPGVPLAFPGQRISADLARYLELVIGAGSPVHGVHESGVETVS